MVKRRVLLPSLVAVFVLLGPGQALAAPRWLDAEPQPATEASGIGPDVATDADGNSVAVWLDGGAVVAAYRPRGGSWAAPEDLDRGNELENVAPRVTVQPDGEFVAAWVATRVVLEDGYPLRWARRPASRGWSAPATITGIGCCPGIAALEASADGSVTVVPTDEGTPSSNTKPPGSETWGPDESVPTGSGSVFAFADDGSAVAVNETCGFPGPSCFSGSYRPPEGPWGPEEPIATLPAGQLVTAYEVTATPGSGYTFVWGEAATQSEGGAPTMPSRVRSADRSPGPAVRGLPPATRWQPPLTVADVPDDVACCIDVAAAPDGTQLSVWQQGDRMAASLRPGQGAGWGGQEDVGAVGSSSAQPFAAFTTLGIPTVAWGSAGAGAAVAHGAHRANGNWSAVPLGPAAEGVVDLRDIAADGDGGALTAFTGPQGVYTAGFDGSGPRYRSAGFGGLGVAGQPLNFVADVSDTWSGVTSVSWLFGDGGSASGASVSHTYASPGAFTATATAADALGNVARQSVAVNIAAPPPPPDPCGTADTDKDGIKNGCDDNNGAERPKPFKTVNATVVSGEVFVKLPAGAGAARATAARKAPKGFRRLLGAETIPVGATLDTAHGRVKIRSAADTKAKKLQSGQFFRGRFSIRQARIKKRSKKLITELRLTGSSFKKACKTKAKASISAKRKKKSKKRVRRLFGNAKGSFRTSGRNAAATVRGTRWGVQDRCDGTLVTVQRGRVEVRDKVKRKTVIVRTGHTYLAGAR